jgi:hypothetical protein
MSSIIILENLRIVVSLLGKNPESVTILPKILFLKNIRMGNGKKGYNIALISVDPNREIITGSVLDNLD